MFATSDVIFIVIDCAICLGGLRENRRHPATYLVHGAKALNNAFRGWTRKEVGVVFFHWPSMVHFCSFQNFSLLVCLNVNEASHHFALSVLRCLVKLHELLRLILDSLKPHKYVCVTALNLYAVFSLIKRGAKPGWICLNYPKYSAAWLTVRCTWPRWAADLLTQKIVNDNARCSWVNRGLYAKWK